MAIRVVVFDVGETLVNEERLWGRWAAYLGVEADVFRSTLAEVIANGEHHRAVFERFSPGLDVERARRDRATEPLVVTSTSSTPLTSTPTRCHACERFVGVGMGSELRAINPAMPRQ
jgi:hypothetical protein